MKSPVSKALGWLVAALFATAVYLYAFPTPTITYGVIVLGHAALGIAALFFLPRVFRRLREFAVAARLGWIAFAISAAFGILLLFIGTSRPRWTWLYIHIAVSVIAVVLLAIAWLS